MKIVPQVKKYIKHDGYCCADSFAWHFDRDADTRVKKAALRICQADIGVPVYISHGDSGEGYTLKISPDRIDIHGKGAAGAFYALTSLKMLFVRSCGKMECCEIEDAPDMPYRGFYQDTTRGRVPKLETLKALADILAEYKINSLQLYVEHSYEFKEYEFCREKLGYLTKAEVQELDAYCNERFIELVPSLSTFGHLYHLLQSEQYKHLCELRDYVPKRHHFSERMAHHTINPLKEESFELIKSLMDQHMEAFTSDKFNICCDETFDLGSDVNRDCDKAELYIGFVKKLIAYLESKGKRVMMWGDIALKHRERLSEFPESVTFLNWGYSANPPEEQYAALSDKTQIVCPGTNSWCGFHERLDIEEKNITRLAEFGHKYGAVGILNTNWGDIGNPASVYMAAYGLILGGAVGWDNTTMPTDEYTAFVSEYHYGCADAVNMLSELSRASARANWLSYQSGRQIMPSQEVASHTQNTITSIIERIKASEFKNERYKNEFLMAAEADSLLCEWTAAKDGFPAPSPVDYDKWSKTYRESWLEGSKQSELEELMGMFDRANSKAKGI